MKISHGVQSFAWLISNVRFHNLTRNCYILLHPGDQQL
jgi:hypothetical protein